MRSRIRGGRNDPVIIGAHIMLQSKDEAADKAFLADVLGLKSVDAGQGFLIFGIPPAEVAVHESDRNDVHQLFFMCDDMEVFAADMTARGIAFLPPRNQGWGTLTEITLPGGGKLGVYEPHHARPKHSEPKPKKKAPRRRAAAKAPSRRGAVKKATKVKPRKTARTKARKRR
jgi:hypothetical protein